MYAVIKSGGKQYRVAAGDTVKLESVAGDIGQQLKLTDVLTIADGDNLNFGAPFVAGAAVMATVLTSRAARQGHDFQDAAPQAFSEARWASAELHRVADRQHWIGRLNRQC